MPHPSVLEGWNSTSAVILGFSFGSDLAVAFGDDGELHAEGMQEGMYCLEAWVGSCA